MTREAWVNELPLYNHQLDEELFLYFLREKHNGVLHLKQKKIYKEQQMAATVTT
jgi:hypothetical protein